jgi:Ca-activated chloride channel family protein
MTLLCACLIAAGLDPQAPGPPPVFSAGVEAVYLDVFVTSKGRPVAGLAAADFEVRDNDVPQAPTLVDLQRVGLTAALVFDTSGSVAGEKLSQLRAAGHAFVDGLGERDSASLLTFSEEVLLPVAATRDRAALHRALDRIGARGATAVRDALYVALRLPRDGGRPMVLLFTDGEDTLSWLTPDEILAAARQSDVLIDVVASPEPRDPMSEYRATVRQPDLLRQEQGVPAAPSWERVPRSDEDSAHVRFLRQVAETTGGALWTAASSDLPRVFRDILAAARTRYVLSYEPRGVPRTGRHRLKVSVKGRRVDVRTRTEYAVPSP